MQTGQTIRTKDLAKAVYGEQGIFEAVNLRRPDQTLRLTCTPNASISSAVQLGPEGPDDWQITKIADAAIGQTQELQQNARTKAAGQD